MQTSTALQHYPEPLIKENIARQKYMQNQVPLSVLFVNILC